MWGVSEGRGASSIMNIPPLLEGRGGSKGGGQEIASFLRRLICNDWRGIMAKTREQTLS